MGPTLIISSYEPDVTSTTGKVSGPLIISQECGLDSALGSMNLNSPTFNSRKASAIKKSAPTGGDK